MPSRYRVISTDYAPVGSGICVKEEGFLQRFNVFTHSIVPSNFYTYCERIRSFMRVGDQQFNADHERLNSKKLLCQCHLE